MSYHGILTVSKQVELVNLKKTLKLTCKDCWKASKVHSILGLDRRVPNMKMRDVVRADKRRPQEERRETVEEEPMASTQSRRIGEVNRRRQR
jgi:hypothetical protein